LTPEATGYVLGSRNWNAFRSAWEAAVATAGLESFRCHDLRHTFASWLVQRGRTLKEVQEALGHTMITMTMRYSHLAPDQLRAAVAALDGVLSSRESEPTKVSAQGSAQEAVAVSGVSAN
jgi:integrase